MFNGEQKNDWFKEINPKQKVPALKVKDNLVLTESVVICKYLCHLAGNVSIYPNNPLAQAQIDEAIEDARIMKWAYFPMTKFFGKPESAEGLKEVEDSMQSLVDLRFKNGNTFLVGDSITLADIVLAVNISMATIIGQYNVEAKYPALIKG